MTKTIVQVSLEISGDVFSPQCASDYLKLRPTRQYEKGDLVEIKSLQSTGINTADRPPLYRKESVWSYALDLEESHSVAKQTKKLARIFTPTINELLSIQQKFNVQVAICAYLQFYDNDNPVIAFEKSFIAFMSAINAGIYMDIYFYSESYTELDAKAYFESLMMKKEPPAVEAATPKTSVQVSLIISSDDYSPQFTNSCLKLGATEQDGKEEYVEWKSSKVLSSKTEDLPQLYKKNSVWRYELDFEESYDISKQAEKLENFFEPQIAELLTIQQRFDAKFLIRFCAKIYDDMEPAFVVESCFIAFSHAIGAEIDIAIFHC